MKNIIHRIRLSIALFIALGTIFMLRLAGSGGTSLPGKLAMIISPNILTVLSAKYRIVMVTGTNGKTTTARMIEQVLKENRIAHVANKSGANLLSGLATVLISDVGMNARPRSQTALLEVDEAAFRLSSKYMKPAVLVVTNFFRDQLDRFGELYSTLNAVREGISRLPDTTLVLNADDSLCASLGKDVPNPVIYYGMNELQLPDEGASSDNHDASYCMVCKAKYVYRFRTYGHLGHFECPECGYSRPEALIQVDKIFSLSGEFSKVLFNTQSGAFTAQINLPGLYNIYNALAAVSFAELLGFSHEKTIHALSRFESGFGRMESISLGEKNIQVILIKNPTGFNQVINFLLTVENPAVISLSINDQLADGTDISWLWDVHFEALAEIQNKVTRFFVSGIRAEDMAVRLKYAGVFTDQITLEKDYGTMLDKALEMLEAGQTLYILPTYTAMLDIRKILKKRYHLKNIWQ
ncbi:MAG: Mur ligase family protein [Ruminiclostridium sp.]|nr:Mur ligase family protein [Ruminiclostridium sp.]